MVALGIQRDAERRPIGGNIVAGTSMRTLTMLSTLVMILTVPGCGRDLAGNESADLVIRDAAIYTVDRARPWAKALAVKDGRIVYVGDDAGAAKWIGAATKVVNLAGKLVLPGFQDDHAHALTSGVEHSLCALYDYKTPDEYVRAVTKCAADNPDEEWIHGGGWDIAAFPPNGIPDKKLLDAVVPDRPIHLSNREGHGAWVNSRALQLAGITKDTADPPNGRIDRDPATGEPVGSLQEAASELVSNHIPPMRKEWIERGMAFTVRYLNGFGITAWQDASVSYDPDDTYQMFDTYQRALSQGKLNAHVVLALRWNKNRGLEQIEEIKAAAKRVSSPDLNAYTVKIRLDGIIDTHTAALIDAYSDRPGFKGETQVPPELLKQAVAALDAAGFQVHVHAIGDGTVRQALDAFEYARRQNGGKLDNRHHIAHLQLVHPDDLPRFKELGVNANFQPRWFYHSKAVEMTESRIGPERMKRVYPIQDVLRAGARVGFGSDWMVTSVNPLEAIEVAVTRMGPFGETSTPFLPEQRITLEQAIAGYTIGAAYINHLDDRTGSLEVGKLADLVVLDRNLFKIEPSEISDARVLLTLFAGRPVHGDWRAVEVTVSDPTKP